MTIKKGKIGLEDLQLGNSTFQRTGRMGTTVTLEEIGENLLPYLNIDLNVGIKNYLINGNFDIWQRGTSFNSVVSGDYTADRWLIHSINGSGETVNVSQQSFTLGQTDVPGEPEFFLRHDVSVAGTGETDHIYGQRIESVRTFAGQTINLSFYAKAGSAITLPYIKIRQYFGSGGTPSTSVVTEVGANVSIETAWTKYTYSFSIPSISSKTLGTNADDSLQLLFCLPLNSTFTFDLAKVQLEKGSQATEFEMRPMGKELALCQRYYEETFSCARGYADAADRAAQTPIYFNVRKRTSPSLTVTDGDISNVSLTNLYSVSSPADSKMGARFNITSAASGDYYHVNAKITVDAEL